MADATSPARADTPTLVHHGEGHVRWRSERGYFIDCACGWYVYTACGVAALPALTEAWIAHIAGATTAEQITGFLPMPQEVVSAD